MPLLYPSHPSNRSNRFPKFIDRYSRNRRSGRHYEFDYGFYEFDRALRILPLEALVAPGLSGLLFTER